MVDDKENDLMQIHCAGVQRMQRDLIRSSNGRTEDLVQQGHLYLKISSNQTRDLVH